MGILQVVCGDISEFRVRQFDKPPPGDVPSDTKAHNPRALLAFEEEILQIADCLAGDAVEIEPVSAKLLQKREFSPFLEATRISLILNFAFSGLPKNTALARCVARCRFYVGLKGIKISGLPT